MAGASKQLDFESKKRQLECESEDSTGSGKRRRVVQGGPECVLLSILAQVRAGQCSRGFYEGIAAGLDKIDKIDCDPDLPRTGATDSPNRLVETGLNKWTLIVTVWSVNKNCPWLVYLDSSGNVYHPVSPTVAQLAPNELYQFLTNMFYIPELLQQITVLGEKVCNAQHHQLQSVPKTLEEMKTVMSLHNSLSDIGSDIAGDILAKNGNVIEKFLTFSDLCALMRTTGKLTKLWTSHIPRIVLEKLLRPGSWTDKAIPRFGPRVYFRKDSQGVWKLVIFSKQQFDLRLTRCTARTPGYTTVSNGYPVKIFDIVPDGDPNLMTIEVCRPGWEVLGPIVVGRIPRRPVCRCLCKPEFPKNPVEARLVKAWAQLVAGKISIDSSNAESMLKEMLDICQPLLFNPKKRTFQGQLVIELKEPDVPTNSEQAKGVLSWLLMVLCCHAALKTNRGARAIQRFIHKDSFPKLTEEALVPFLNKWATEVGIPIGFMTRVGRRLYY